MVKKLKTFLKRFMYTDIQNPNFTMGMYITLVVDKKLNVLCKIPFIPKSLKIEVSNDIVNQYLDITKNTDIKRKQEKTDRYNKYVRYHEFLRGCLIVLTSNVKQEEKNKVEEKLKRDFNCSGDVEKWCKAEINLTKIKIDDLKEQLKSKEEQKKTTTRQDFANIFQVLHKNGYRSDFNISVLDYIEAIGLFKKEIKALEKIKNK